MIIIILAAVAPLAEDLGGVIKEAIQSEVENSSEIQTDTADLNSAVYNYQMTVSHNTFHSVSGSGRMLLS